MRERLVGWAAERGYRVAWGPTRVVGDARREILERRRRGELDESFVHDELDALTGEGVVDDGATVVAVAKPVPAYLVHFRVDGAAVDALLPPTYVRYRATFEDVRQDLERHGLPGARVEHLGWPLKAVAARLGLVRYGRNNITYAPGLGSYIQLCVFLTDAALPPIADVTVPELLEECAACSACASACPADAIDAERVLLRAERCLTRANENAGPWPPALPRSAHHCLLGCLLCQRACPVNGDLETVDTGLEFSEAETRALLEEGPRDRGRAETGIRFKLAWLGQPYAEPVIGRNLRALLDAAV
ncbi:MAG TPA: 4Fe-4S double cluster binding domain-containing protein [Thermoanaerobaculaceae bacterium]|nr:4Fe-4S double cluster binding domain-containing protein [Thermoanaerobaculaceae bacterium]